MSGFIYCLKLIYAQRKLILSWRFAVPIFLVLLAAGWLVVTQAGFLSWLDLSLTSLPLPAYAVWLILFIIGLLAGFKSSPVENKLIKDINRAIKDLKNIEAEKLIQQAQQFYIVLPKSKIELGCLEADVYVEQGCIVDAYNLLQELKNLTLLPAESIDVEIDLMLLLFASGNYKAAKHALERLEKRKMSDIQKFKCRLKNIELHLADNKLKIAKDLLENDLLNHSLSANMKVCLLHTLAVVETHQKNYIAAVNAYRQAWDIQKKLKNSFAQAERTIDNLAQTYAKQDLISEIKPYIDELEALADLGNVDHLIALHNIKLNLARQLNDRPALLATYQEAENNILPKLHGKHRFHYLVNSLRMHWNDSVSFESAFKASQQAMLDCSGISPLSKLTSIKEVLGTVKQAILQAGPHPELMMYCSWLMMEFQRLQPEIDQLLVAVPANLPGPRSWLIGFKIESVKHNLSYQRPSKALFERLFELLNEQRNLWQGMHNTESELNELMIIVDEYNAYKTQLANPQFEQDFKHYAIAALEDASQLLNDNLQHLAYSDKLIGFAYACYQLNTKKEQARIWLEAYDKTKLSLNHNAAWLREQYMQTKAWVGEDLSQE